MPDIRGGGLVARVRRAPWQRLGRRMLMALILGLIVAFAPLPPTLPGWLLALQVPVGVFVLVILIGKAIVDTLI